MSENFYTDSIHTESVRKIKSMASIKYGREVRERGLPYALSWRFKQGPNDPAHSKHDDPLFWRLDTWVNGVNAHCIFAFGFDDCTEELIETRFTAMDIAREEFIKSHSEEEE